MKEIDAAKGGKALVAVCHCDYDLAACGACGKGWSQEKAAGRDPKMIPESDVKKPGGTSTRFSQTCYFSFSTLVF